MPTGAASPQDRARDALEELGLGRAVLEPLAPDASTRSFYRARLDGGSWVVMVESRGAAEALARYVGVARWMRGRGLPVPEVRAVASDADAVVLEDLGTQTLRAELESARPAARRALLSDALDLVARLQVAGLELGPDCPAYHARFDRALYLRELEFFREHYLRGLVSAPADAPELGRSFEALAETLAARPPVLTHRDFHIDNLLLRQGTLWMVDFQDARWGPAAYDVASLLTDRDIHRFADAETRQQLAEAFASRRGLDAAAFRDELALAVLQRGLKAVGTFAYQARQGRLHYLAYIGPTLERVARVLPEDGPWRPFGALLKSLPEKVYRLERPC